MKPRAYLALPWVLIAAGVVLVFQTTRLPFTAGSSATDLLAPVSALGCGVAAVVTAWEALRGVAQARGSKALALIALILALLVAAAAALVLAFIFVMCGNYWARDTC